MGQRGNKTHVIMVATRTEINEGTPINFKETTSHPELGLGSMIATQGKSEVYLREEKLY